MGPVEASVLLRGITHGTAVAALGAIAGLCACGLDETSPLADSGPQGVDVAPRVVMDGLIELGARADRVVVDEVLLHVPSVRDVDGRDVTDVLKNDAANDAPLLFRFDATSRDGFGDVLGGQRHWVIDGDGDLVFDFEHFTPTAPQMEKLEAGTGVKLGELSGHTGVVHGYMLTRSSAGDGTKTGFGVGGACADGDPDGNPATCTRNRSGQTADGDPDGNPAKGADGDPDGNPAKGNDADGDPDGNPAHPSGDGDPDGNPSQDTGTHAAGKHVDHAFASSDGEVIGVHEHGGYTPVPFFLVLDDVFALRTPVRDVLDGQVGEGQVLPIDLHVQLDQILTDDLLHKLDEQASDDTAGAIVVNVDGGSAFAINIQAHGVTRVRQTVTTHGIRVVADNR